MALDTIYNVSLAYIALIRNRNSPNHTRNMKFNGGRSVDQPINTDIDVGAVAPCISIIPIHPHDSVNLFDFIFFDFIINPFFLNLYFIIPSIIEKVKGPCSNRYTARITEMVLFCYLYETGRITYLPLLVLL